MAAAIESVTKDEMNVTEASKVFNVPQQTLDNWLKGKFGKVGAGRNTELIPEEEKVLVKHFIHAPETNHLRLTLLVLDGHGSHGTNTTHLFFELISLVKEENMYILFLPPHATNILQPLDVGVFRPLKANLPKLTDGLRLLSVTGNCPNK